MVHPKLRMSFLIMGFIVVNKVSAQVLLNSDSLKGTLEEIVITGQPKPQSIKKSVYQIKVIGKERIQKQAATKLQDVLANELNIRFNQDMATGGSDITMMGLKGQNVKILLDGLPIIGRQGISNEININQIDINSIERIEIVEGPMSVIYGADALAGVINIITKNAGKTSWNITARLQEETVGIEYGTSQGIHNQYLSTTYKKNKIEVGAAIGKNFFGGWKGKSIDRELLWHKKDQILANGFVGFSTNKFNVKYRIDGLDEIITNPGNFLFAQQASGDTLAIDQEYLSKRVMQQLQANYTVNNKLNVNTQLSYTDFSRQVYSTTVSKKNGSVRLAAGTNMQSIINFTGLTYRTSANYKINTMFNIQTGVDINTETGEGERLKKGTNKVADYAFFATGEINPTSKISIRPGARVIKNSLYKAPPIIPSINTKFVLSKNIDVRFSYANGFRSPSLRELYFNFFDANHQIVGNPNLKAEISNSFTGSLNWQKNTKKKINYTIALNGFYNSIKNLIDYAISETNPNEFILTNVSSSKTGGINGAITTKYKNWNIALGSAYTGFYNEYSETEKTLPQMQWSTEVNTTVGYKFVKLGLDVNLFYKHTGKRPVYIFSNQQYVLTSLKGFDLADFTINKNASKYLTINTGIRNLFNVTSINSNIAGTGIHAANGVRNVANGRSYFIGLLFNLNK